MRIAEKPLKPRPRYTDLLMEARSSEAVKVLVGMRRCGKSSILELFRRQLLEEGVPRDRIISLNFESGALMDVRTPEDLVARVEQAAPLVRVERAAGVEQAAPLARVEQAEQLVADPGRFYLLLDEVQMVEGWERAVNALRVDLDADIYITGSNAYLLSSKLSTLLSGRSIQIPVHPLSYTEFLEYTGLSAGAEAFQTYLRYGGLPPVANQLDDLRLATMTLSGIYDTIFMKDVASHVQVRNPRVFQDITSYLASTVGTGVSVSNIENYLKSAHRKTSNETIERYLDALVDANLFGRARRWDLRGKQNLQGLEKYYPLDLGIRNMLCGFADRDLGYALENFVYIELVGRGYEVSVGKQGALEVDFVARRDGRKVLIQVALTLLASDATRSRELEPLRRAGDADRRMVLTADTLGLGQVDGIDIVNVTDWALGGR